MRTFLVVTTLFVLTACGGGGGGGGGSGGGSGGGTFAVSGFVSSGISGVPIANATIRLSGRSSATTTTDGTGAFSFTGLGNGNYTLTAVLVDAVFAPENLAFTVDGSNVRGQDFLGFRGTVLDDSIEFLPATFSSANQLRVSLQVADNSLVYTDSSAAPLKKQPLDGSPPSVLAGRFSPAANVVSHAGDMYWIEAGDLFRMRADGTVTRLADGLRADDADVSSDIIVDDTHVYWVDQAANQPCSPPCNWVLQKIPVDGGPAIDLATADRRIAAVIGDATTIYWEEDSSEPWEDGCNCGSKIRSVAKSGGAPALLVDGSLNGGIPIPPPGYTPASWMPAGGITLSGDTIVFATTGNLVYEIKSVPTAGGAVSDLASVPTPTSFSRRAVLNLSAAAATVYWIDSGNGSIDAMPVGGGAVTALATGLSDPGQLAVGAAAAYWTERGGFSGCCRRIGSGSISYVPLAGGAAAVLVDNLDAPDFLAVDAGGVTWAEPWRIGRFDFGGSPTTVHSGISSDLAQIALSQSNIYVLDRDYIKVAPLAGGPLEKLASARLGAIDDASYADGDIVTDDLNVYWSIRPVAGVTVVQQMPLAGGAPIVISGTGPVPHPQDCYWRLEVHSAAVYWSEGSSVHGVGCAIKKVASGGGAVTTLVDEPYLADFTVDGAHVYYSEFLFDPAPTIRRLPVDGGESELVADDVAGLVMASNDERIFWLDLQHNGLGLMRKDATDPTDWTMLTADLVMDPLLALDGLLIHGGSVFLSESQVGGLYEVY